MAFFFHRIRLPLMAASLLALLAAMWAGLLRLGWALPPLTPPPGGPARAADGRRIPRHANQPGAVCGAWKAMDVCAADPGRARRPGAPGWSALFISLSLAVLSSLGLIAVFVLIVRRQPALFNFTMLVGAVAWSVGSILALSGQPVYRVVYWWAGFWRSRSCCA